ncbi:2-succinyl-6-hydroxy-2,4-cyclohexadiene-1-carboxylate synthase [Vibrio sp. V27_P1S3P104]|uniref:2-succinyl-6-hydroxy-2, 4-cyclohexadiene-1-carboxylate synthase n=1 Tax=unclassified Vibrio TaxID=2614977 RepID=UPI00137365D8|nr:MULTISPECIES: 2-succinyl-6-hydroxy-2,4-cyclohexadiene-1-carboxylate synthase [unclassified Vibrio]NAW69209.1 2-succinyl-6-hydroxy-2,4-cyclohexadiene-1-carboxylate synthase [Vibrio sp. V28_P6S34P95]NAX05408.1 2-succinyl-6-hydroxy-2,4-cyclohexadiene-1-carboxylate synthase [Vibrio sp. V30_P3S12P165]NAX34919.1 2-succinyl-6-hydroxy-2,4-cyclohexadiene-1-carboxylate synthase [Vibrio sp. V29_P1S30P107]NAX37166.1 2-succinyl-6-hydroxy-2,4-cyclohexadiene-1-carboxylate synthase [Vibrio sp. V27_P1S3P104]
MLYSCTSSFTQTLSARPVLVFLHGLLGSGDDWQPVLERLNQEACLTIDLPGHGQSQSVICHDFASCCQHIKQTILIHYDSSTPIWFVGYSLGGRIAMTGCAEGWFDQLNIQGLVVEGGHFGLLSETEKNARWQHDQHWAMRFKSEPIAQVLADWYQQAVFSSLNHEQRQTLIRLRSGNLGHPIARMLLATSLATQPYLLPRLMNLPFPVHYVCGQHDQKFRQLAEHSGLSYSVIDHAGHNVHHEQPDAFAQIVKKRLLTPA